MLLWIDLKFRAIGLKQAHSTVPFVEVNRVGSPLCSPSGRHAVTAMRIQFIYSFLPGPFPCVLHVGSMQPSWPLLQARTMCTGAHLTRRQHETRQHFVDCHPCHAHTFQPGQGQIAHGRVPTASSLSTTCYICHMSQHPIGSPSCGPLARGRAARTQRPSRPACGSSTCCSCGYCYCQYGFGYCCYCWWWWWCSYPSCCCWSMRRMAGGAHAAAACRPLSPV